MDTPEEAQFWNALHEAYESHNPEEARRLFQQSGTVVNCSILQRCGDEQYIQWLLHNNIIHGEQEGHESWPGLQERQLQCNDLDESQRPRCILEGDWEEPENVS